MNLSKHFTAAELGVADACDGTDERLVANARYLCEQLLEPIREHYGRSVFVHDGYRTPEHNGDPHVGGKSNSFHLFVGGHAAADIHVDSIPLTELFRWIRMESKLPFDKVILEHTLDAIPRCVHLQIDAVNPPRREAYVGMTGDGKSYLPVEVA